MRRPDRQPLEARPVRGQPVDLGNTSGQGNAAKRAGEGVTGTEGQRAKESPEAPPEKSAQAGQGADAAQQAKVALDEARTADSKGDAKGCEAAVSRAEQQLKKAP